MTHNQW